MNVKAATFASKRPDKVIAAGLKILSGIGAAKKKLKAEQATLVAGFGGYPAFPALAAARRAGIPIIIHDQNAVLGRVNGSSPHAPELSPADLNGWITCPPPPRRANTLSATRCANRSSLYAICLIQTFLKIRR